MQNVITTLEKEAKIEGMMGGRYQQLKVIKG